MRSWLIRVAILLALTGAVVLVLARMEYRWDWSGAWEYRGRFAGGLATTLYLSLGALVVGIGLGTIGCLLRLARTDALSFLGTIYVELVRGTPLLVQLYIAYFCLPKAVGYEDPSPPLVGCLALGVFAGAYIAEILRAGVESIDPGQTEAALSLGMTRMQTLVYVVAPQAIRRVVPPLTGQFVSLVKDSSLLSIISVIEVTKIAELRAATSYRVFESYLPLALLYLAITFPLSRLSVRLERRLATRG